MRRPRELVLAAVAALLVLAAPQAQAAPIGGLLVVPGESIDLAAIRVRTSGGCPPSADAYYATVHGTGFPADGLVVTANTSAGLSHDAGFDVYFAQTMKDFADDNHTTLGGRYDITVLCIDSFTQVNYGEFTGSMQFATPTSYQALGTAKPTGPPPSPLPLAGGAPPVDPGSGAAATPEQLAAASSSAPDPGPGLLPIALIAVAVAAPLAALIAVFGRRRRPR